MQVRAILLAAALALAPLNTQAADLVVWWEEGFYSEEHPAVRELVAAFEHKTGKQVELVLHPQNELPAKVLASIEAGQPPDLVYGIDVAHAHFLRWGHERRLADLTDTLGSLVDQFERDALADTTLLDASTGRRGLYALPMGRITNHLHVWKSLLEPAGFTLANIPKDWEGFWSFWCDKVQPAVRKATGREDIYGIGLPMSFLPAGDTMVDFLQFAAAYGADYVTRDGRLVINEPSVRANLVKAVDSDTTLHRKGCVPPDAAEWSNYGNNKAFLEQRVVLTVNNTLSIPGELRESQSEDYYKNTATIEWPSDVNGQTLAIITQSSQAAVFKAGGHEEAALEFVRFLVGDGWLGHWLNFAGDRYVPPMPALAEQPFWLDPGDPHRMASVMQLLNRPRSYSYAAASSKWRHQLVDAEGIWPKAVHRVIVEGISPEQAVDEAIARIKQILSE